MFDILQTHKCIHQYIKCYYLCVIISYFRVAISSYKAFCKPLISESKIDTKIDTKFTS